MTPMSYYISDAIQASVLLAVALLIRRGTIPPLWSSAAFTVAVVVNNLALNFQYTLIGYSAVGVMLLVMAAYAAVTLVWRPFLISAAIMSIVTTYTLVVNDPENGPGWVVTMFTALAVSGVILYGLHYGARALAEANLAIERLATRDELTGLLNRRGLQEAGDTLLALAARDGNSVFVAFVDITGLKQVNDQHGHAVGDLVIRRSAEALVAQCRDSDVVCRWGGDEFVVVGQGSLPDAPGLAGRIQAGVETEGLEGVWNPGVWVGIAAAGAEGITLDSLIRLADEAMYASRSPR